MEAINLPIAPYLAAIVQNSNNNMVSIVKGPPGIGKSLGIPYIFSRFNKRIYITQTRGNAVISLTNTQKIMNPNYKVGYGKDGDITYQPDNNVPQIAYVTSGHLLGRILRNISKGDNNPLRFIDILQIDDPDSVEDEVLISLWRYFFNLNVTTKSGMKLPRLLLTSATINPEFYPGIANTIINLTSKTVDDIYHTRSYDVDNNQLYLDMADEVAQFHLGSREGHFLVFCSGKDKIDLVIKRLNEKQLPNVQILPAYARLGTAQINNIYNDVPAGMRKIIVSTNMAETAITIKDLGGVFDCMSVKQMYSTPNGGSRLKVVYESKQNALQRRGRTGRNIDGFYYPMMTQSDFENLDPIPEPILDRSPLHKITMELLAAGLNPVEVVEGYGQGRFDETVQLLVSLGAIRKDNRKYIVTNLGRFVASSPLSVRNSAFVYRMYEQYLRSDKSDESSTILGAGIVIANIIDSYGPPLTWFPSPHKNESTFDYQARIYHHKQHFYKEYVGISDLEVYLKIWAYYVNSNRKNRRINVFDPTYVKEWCRQHSINNKKLTEIIKLNARITRLLANLYNKTVNSNIVVSTKSGQNIGSRSSTAQSELKINLRINIKDIEQYINISKQYLQKAYIDRIMQRSDPRNKEIVESTPLFYNHLGEKANYLLSLNQSVSEMAKLRPQYIISLADITQKKPTKMVRFISLAIPADKSADELVSIKMADIQDMLLSTSSESELDVVTGRQGVSLPKINPVSNIIPSSAVTYDNAGHQDIVKPITINYESKAIPTELADIMPSITSAPTGIGVTTTPQLADIMPSIASPPKISIRSPSGSGVEVKTPNRIQIKVRTPPKVNITVKPITPKIGMIGTTPNISEPPQSITLPQFAASPATCSAPNIDDQAVGVSLAKVKVGGLEQLRQQMQKGKSGTKSIAISSSGTRLEELKPQLQVGKPSDRLAGQSVQISFSPATTSAQSDIVDDFLNLDI